MNAKRVCHIVHSEYPSDGRIRQQCEALVQAGYEVEVFSLRDEGESAREVVNGVRAHRMPLSRRRGGMLRYALEYVAFFVMVFVAMTRRAWKYHVVHVSNMPDFLIFSAAIPKLFGAKLILDEHDPMAELLVSKYGIEENSFVVRMLRWQEKISIRFANHVVTVNQAMRARIEKVAGGVPVSVVMNLPESWLFTPSATPPLGIPPSGRFTVLYTGTVTKTYGLSIVIDAAEHLCARIPGLLIRIVGGGDYLPALQEMVKARGLEHCIQFTGMLHYTRIPEIISQSNVGIATLNRDVLTDLCFNNKTVEYLAMGLPAVVVRTLTYDRTFPEGTVRFYEPGDRDSFEQAVIDLYEHPEKRAAMSKRGIEFSRSHNWSTEKPKYVALVDSLCKQEYN
jgi:glycosyltransferase involved in cell wall biosynthesis